MDRFYLQLRLLTVALLVAAAGCGSDTTTVPDEGEPTERACARVFAWGHWADGRKHTIGTTRHTCVCMTEEEYQSGSRLDELNDLLLADCNLDAEQYDFEWTECAMWHASRSWIGEDGEFVTWPTNQVIYPPGASVTCW